MKNTTKKRNFWFEVLIGEVNPIFIKKYEFEFQDKNFNWNFLYFFDYQDSDARNKIRGLSLEHSFTSPMLWLESFMDEVNL